MKALIRLIMLIFLIYGCTKGMPDKLKATDYVAKIDSFYITKDDLRKELNALPAAIMKNFSSQEGKKIFLNEVIKKYLIYLEATKQGIDNIPEYKERIEEFKRMSLINMLLSREIEHNISVTEKDAKQYYDAHSDEFSQDRARASHILVKTEKEAEDVYQKIQLGEDFIQIAKKRSLDAASAVNGGDLGYFSKGQMVPEFEFAVFSMKKGEISKPVKTQFGFHIIKLTDLQKGKKVEFEKMKDSIMKQLKAEKQREVFEQYISNLRKSYTIEIREEKLAEIKFE